MLQFFVNSDTHSYLPPIYRRVATEESFRYYIEKWIKYPNHTIGFFAFHGEKGKLNLGRDCFTLVALGELLKGQCAGKHILLSSCNTLAVAPEELHWFRKITKARSVSGYSKSPDWLEGSAFDLMVMSNLLYHNRPSEAETWLRKNCEGLMKEYGFVIEYRTRYGST